MGQSRSKRLFESLLVAHSSLEVVKHSIEVELNGRDWVLQLEVSKHLWMDDTNRADLLVTKFH